MEKRTHHRTRSGTSKKISGTNTGRNLGRNIVTHNKTPSSKTVNIKSEQTTVSSREETEARMNYYEKLTTVKSKQGKLNKKETEFIEKFFVKKLLKPINKLEKEMDKKSIKEVDDLLMKYDSRFQNIIEHMSRQNIFLMEYEKEATAYILIVNRIKRKNHTFIRQIKNIFRKS